MIGWMHEANIIFKYDSHYSQTQFCSGQTTVHENSNSTLKKTPAAQKRILTLLNKKNDPEIVQHINISDWNKNKSDKKRM